MAIGSVAVTVTSDATNFWRDFRAKTNGQANAEGRRQGEEFRRGFEGRPVKIKAELDAARIRGQLDELTRSQTVRVRADTSQARGELRQLDQATQQSSQGILQALLPLAPALAPLGAAAIGVGAALGTLAGSGILAFLGFKEAIADASTVGDRAAASIGAVKNSLDGLEAVAAKAALPGLEASVAAITTEVPKLRSLVATEASTAGSVIAHLVRGITGGFGNFGPLIQSIGSDVDEMAAHFEAFATGPGGARFAKTLTTDYAEVRPVLESVVQAVLHIAQAATSSGLGVLHILGEVANLIDSFPTPVLTAIVDGFLAFRAVAVASTAINAVQRSFVGLKTNLAGVAAATQAASAERIAAEAQVAAATAAAEAEMRAQMLASAEAAQAFRLEQILSNSNLSASELALLETQATAADAQIADYEAVAAAAQAAAVQQAAAAEEAAAAASASRGAAGAGSLAGSIGKFVGPLVLVGAAIPLLTAAFGDNGDQAQKAAQQVDGYASALLNSKGAIDDTVRSQVAKNLQDSHLFDNLRQYGVTQQELTNAVIQGGPALDTLTSKIDAQLKAQGASSLAIGTVNDALAQQHDRLTQGAQAAANQAAATDSVTASIRSQASALHANVTDYQAAVDAAAKSTAQTRAQTVAFQLENDAASLLSQALKGLAGQNLDVAQAQTGFEQSVNSVAAALKKNKDAIRGHGAAALEDQQAIQGSVASARQYADAVAKQTGSSNKAATAYRNSRDALLSQLKATGQLTPALRKYINGLFDVKGVSDYLRAHPTKLDADPTAARQKVSDLQHQISEIRQNHVPGIKAGTLDAKLAILDLQHQIDILHGKDIYIHTITTGGPGNGGGGTQGNTPIAQATGGFISGPGTSTSDSIPAWLSNGEYVVNARATAKHRHLLESINKGVRGFATGGPVLTRSQRSALSDPVVVERSSKAGAQVAANKAFRAQVQLGVKIEGKDLLAFRAALNSTAAAAHAAFQRMYDDAKKLGIDGTTAKYLRREEAQIEKLINKRNKARDAFKQLASSIRDSVAGSFDVTGAGVANGQAKPSFGSIFAEAKQDAAKVKEFAAGIRKLAKEGLNNTELSQLAAAGPSALPQVQALEAATPAQLKKLNSTYATITSTGSSLGQYVGDKLYGKTIRDDNRQIAKDQRLLTHALAYEVDRLSRRPIQIKVDGKIVATASDTGHRRNGRRR